MFVRMFFRRHGMAFGTIGSRFSDTGVRKAQDDAYKKAMEKAGSGGGSSETRGKTAQGGYSDPFARQVVRSARTAAEASIRGSSPYNVAVSRARTRLDSALTWAKLDASRAGYEAAGRNTARLSKAVERAWEKYRSSDSRGSVKRKAR
jgi:hypothetical protein